MLINLDNARNTCAGSVVEGGENDHSNKNCFIMGGALLFNQADCFFVFCFCL